MMPFIASYGFIRFVAEQIYFKRIITGTKRSKINATSEPFSTSMEGRYSVYFRSKIAALIYDTPFQPTLQIKNIKTYSLIVLRIIQKYFDF